VQFKRVTCVESLPEKVFDRMMSASGSRGASARKVRARPPRIEGTIEKDLRKIDSEAYREAEEVRGQADSEAAKIHSDAYLRQASILPVPSK
jgi:modulator of FtsH protease HflC